MMIPSNYYINVAREGVYRKDRYNPRGLGHYCRIELGEVLPETAMERFGELKKMFPESEFELKLYYVSCNGREVKE